MWRSPVILTVAVLVAGCGGSSKRGTPEAAARLHLSSPAFTQNSRLPAKYTCDGAGEEPVVRAGTVPTRTKELVLIVTDTEAKGGPFVHVTRYGLGTRGDGTVSEGGTEGRNSAGSPGWSPPCPPKGDAPHSYVWTVYALSDPSGLSPGATPAQVSDAVQSGVLAAGSLTAQYAR